MNILPHEMRVARMRYHMRPNSRAMGGLKRAFDLSAAGIGLVAIFPLLLLIAGAIRLESSGPVLYRQLRHGRGRAPFSIIKFRTLTVCDDDTTFRQVSEGDSRVTRVGRILRRLNLDELPQLWNVIAGDMSLVGPRPHPIAMDRHFEGQIANYARRYSVRPGMTGWAQVNGHRGPTATLETMRTRLRHDLHYIENYSFWLDMRILALTVLSRSAFESAF